MAGKGTLFLDEIGELPLSLQKKLPDFCNTANICALAAILVYVRAAGLSPLLVANWRSWCNYGNFVKISTIVQKVVTLQIPPLRERTSDIPLFSESNCCTKSTLSLGMNVLKLQEGVMERLMAHPWPGNVRGGGKCAGGSGCCQSNAILLEDLKKILETNDGLQASGGASSAISAMEKNPCEIMLAEVGWNKAGEASRRLGIPCPPCAAKSANGIVAETHR